MTNVAFTLDISGILLGVKIQEDQKWRAQIEGIGGVVSSLNPRQFLIRRLQNQIGKAQIKK